MVLCANWSLSNLFFFRMSGSFLDYPGKFPDCPETFQTVQNLSCMSGNIAYFLKNQFVQKFPSLDMGNVLNMRKNLLNTIWSAMETRQQSFWDSATMHDDLCTMQSNKLTAIVWILSCVVFQLYAEHPVELKELKWKRGEQTYRTECSLRLFCCARQSGSLLLVWS